MEPQMTDQPLQPPAARFERVVSALGNLARPNVLYVSAWSAAISTVSIVWMKLELIAGAAFITAAWGGVALLYGAKAAEERGKAKSEAAVLIAQSNPNTTSEVNP
jgi:hypothetical protein